MFPASQEFERAAERRTDRPDNPLRTPEPSGEFFVTEWGLPPAEPEPAGQGALPVDPALSRPATLGVE